MSIAFANSLPKPDAKLTRRSSRRDDNYGVYERDQIEKNREAFANESQAMAPFADRRVPSRRPSLRFCR